MRYQESYRDASQIHPAANSGYRRLMPADIRGNLDRLQRLSASSTQHLVSTRVSQQAQEDALQNLQHLAGQYAEEIRTEFTEALETAGSMATTFAVAKSKENGGLQVGRDEVNAVLLNVLKSQPDFNGTYSCWEPDAIDGQDYLFTDGQNGNNARTLHALLDAKRRRQDRRPAIGGVRHPGQAPQRRAQRRLVHRPAGNPQGERARPSAICRTGQAGLVGDALGTNHRGWLLPRGRYRL